MCNFTGSLQPNCQSERDFRVTKREINLPPVRPLREYAAQRLSQKLICFGASCDAKGDGAQESGLAGPVLTDDQGAPTRAFRCPKIYLEITKPSNAPEMDLVEMSGLSLR